MARIKFSGLVTEIRGSVGGTTFQSNAYGYTVKNKPNMVIPSSMLQQRRKIAFAKATKYWQSLTVAQRATWTTYASTYPQYAANNPESVLSGFALFVKYHTFLWTAGMANPALTTAVLTNPALDVPTPTLEKPAASLLLDGNFSPASGNWYALFFISRVFPVTQNFAGTRTRYVNYNTTDDTFSNITDDYNDLFGVLPAVGQYVYIKIQLMGVNFPMFPAATFWKTIVTV